MICQDGKPNLSNPSTNVRSVLRLKNARFAAGIFHITGGLENAAPPTCSGPHPSLFGGDVDSNFSPDCWLTPHDICYV
jgi:hypothetical protein